jgi:hypothetical protein
LSLSKITFCFPVAVLKKPKKPTINHKNKKGKNLEKNFFSYQISPLTFCLSLSLSLQKHSNAKEKQKIFGKSIEFYIIILSTADHTPPKEIKIIDQLPLNSCHF